MKRTRFSVNSLLLSIFEIAVGILLLIDPVGFTSGIIISFGVALIVVGIISIVKYFRAQPTEGVLGQNLFKGLVAIIAGMFCIFQSTWLVTVFPLLTILYGVAIMLVGVSKIQWTVDMLRLKRPGWHLPALGAVLSIVCAIAILCNPFGSTAVLWAFTAVSLIVEAVFDIIILLVNGRKKGPYDIL